MLFRKSAGSVQGRGKDILHGTSAETRKLFGMRGQDCVCPKGQGAFGGQKIQAVGIQNLGKRALGNGPEEGQRFGMLAQPWSRGIGPGRTIFQNRFPRRDISRIAPNGLGRHTGKGMLCLLSTSKRKHL